MNPSSSPSSKPAIEFDKKTSRYVITIPPWLVDKVRAVPNRRWDPRRRVWTAPALRANSEFLLSNFDSSAFTADALKAAKEIVDRSRSHTVAAFPPVYSFKTTPRAYQLQALQNAWGKHAFAFYMDMGTGKTKTALDLFGAYYLDQKVDRLLVVTKFSTRRNWAREVGIHLPFDADVMILDTSKGKAFDDWNLNSDMLKILIVGTESLAAGSAMAYASKFVSVSTRVGMIVDEAHMIKNHAAVRSNNCMKLGNSAAYKVIMTGTPVANGPMDVFMQFEFLDRNIIGIGDFYSFRNRYAIMGGFEGKQIVGYQNLGELIELVSPYVYQVRKSEVLTELPPKVYEVREVSMTDEQKRLYRELAKKNKAVTGDRGIMVKTVLERMLRLQEVTGGVITYERNPDMFDPSKYEHCRISGKNPKIEELLSIVEENPVSTIVWCRFLEEIRMVSEALRSVYGAQSVVEIHGGVSEADRDHNVHHTFQSGKAQFLVGNAATGGVGLNMTRAELVVYFSNSFSFTDREQSEDRAHRIGQTKSVTYIDLICEGTVDVSVVQALREKKDVSEFVRSNIDSTNANNFYGSLA
jgi:SNF2 family DNA or RNA helicase